MPTPRRTWPSLLLTAAGLFLPACELPPSSRLDGGSPPEAMSVDADEEAAVDADEEAAVDAERPLEVVDGAGAYDTGPADPRCGEAGCAEEVAPGCLSDEVCRNGLDDDCDGAIDEVEQGCSCLPGEVQRCFPGPPGRQGVGLCAEGHQLCQGLEFGAWGECFGGVSPAQERCDGADNDCDGCVDEGLCCGDELLERPPR